VVTFDQLVGKETQLAVVGLGYVGLPLAAAFGLSVKVIGFDTDTVKINRLREGYDLTGELSAAQLSASQIDYTSDPIRLRDAKMIIVTVPTPVGSNNRPDLSPLQAATRTIGENLSRETIVVFESTVYPGVTEEVCAPLLEKSSGLTCGVDFKVAYSPERINPGDKVHTIDKVVKVVSGQDAETLATVADVYGLVVAAGVYRASSIQVAEAAKVIENTQRDLNIALINELALIFHKMNISTRDVLEAAGTKWNFLQFVPGLVGGHCIGVDPYYLTYKAEQLGYLPQVILAGRRINDGMGKYLAEITVKQMIHANKAVKGARVLVLGLTFKENVPDIRNSKVIDIVRELESYGIEVLVHDPLACGQAARAEYGVELVGLEGLKPVDAVILAVVHRAFAELDGTRLAQFCRNGNSHGVVIDVKTALNRNDVENAGLVYWAL